MSNIIDFNKFKNRNKTIEFSWGFDPTNFYPITEGDIDRILYLLSLDKTMTAIFRRVD